MANLEDLEAGFLQSRADDQRTASTLRIHTLWLRQYRHWRGDAEPPLDGAALKAYMACLRDGGASPNTVRSAYITLHALATWAALEGLLDEDAAASIDRVRVPSVPEQIRPTYDPAIFQELIVSAACQAPAFAARDVLALHMLRESGLRASELCGIELDRVMIDAGAEIRGKGGRWSFVSWGETTSTSLRLWLRWRPAASGATLFVQLHPRSVGKPLTYTALRQIFRRLADAAGVELPRGASIHALRHTFAHDMLDAGVDGLEVQQMLRHRHANTTAIYVRQHPAKLRAKQQAALQRLADQRTRDSS